MAFDPQTLLYLSVAAVADHHCKDTPISRSVWSGKPPVAQATGNSSDDASVCSEGEAVVVRQVVNATPAS